MLCIFYVDLILGSNHVMIKSISFNSQIAVSIHKHTTILLVWSRKNFKVIQEIPVKLIE